MDIRLPDHLKKVQVWVITFLPKPPIVRVFEGQIFKHRRIKVKTFGDTKEEAVANARMAAEADLGITLPDVIVYEAQKAIRWKGGVI